jgi:hypothetical protein
MKILTGMVLFVLLGAGAFAQQASTGARIMAEASAMTEKIVKGAPFSAEAVNESVQVLADGNRIVRSSTNRLYRNSEGRFRRDISGGSAGPLASFYSAGPGITILDPVQGQRFLIDSELRTARVGSFGTGQGGFATTVKSAPLTAAQAVTVERLKAAELNAAGGVRAVSPLPAAAVKERAERELVTAVTAAQASGSFVFAPSVGTSKYETRNEELGTQTIEGVEATGTRTVTTIPAGDIGNERPIEIVYERWYSNELQVVVMSKHSDPRFGDQTYRLTNIVRSEPDPSLFELPPGYRVLAEPAGAYTISTGKGQGSQNVVWTKSPASPAAPVAPVVKTKKP